MKKLVLIVLAIAFMAGTACAKDITVKGVPEAITDTQIKEWVGIFVERHENAKINKIPEVTVAAEAAKVSIDTYRKANLLTPKFEKAVAEPTEG